MEIKGSVSKCANCSVSVQDHQQFSGVDGGGGSNNTGSASKSMDGKTGSQKVVSITVSVNDKEIEVPLSVALAEVFKLRPLFDGKTWEDVSTNQLILCQGCSLVFSKLYSLLLDFNCLRAADSFMAETIRNLESLIGRLAASQGGTKSSDIIFQQGQPCSTNNPKGDGLHQSGVKSTTSGNQSSQMQVQLVGNNEAGQQGTTGNGPGYILINVCSSDDCEDQGGKRSGKGGGDRAVKCEKCGEECLSARALGLHRFRHHNTDNPFVCEICKKGFASIINLKLHSQRHSDSRPFECEHCGGTFKMKFDLKQHHHTVHAKDGLQLNLPYERGGKRGRTRLDPDQSSLRQSSSSDIPPGNHGSHQQGFPRPLPPAGISLVFKCTDCGEDFHSAMTLGVHRSSVHQAVDPYKCHLCWQSFPYSNDLRLHLTEHVNGGIRSDGNGRMYNDGYQGNDAVQMMGFSKSVGGNSQPLNLASMYGTSPSSSYDPASLLEVNLEEPEMNNSKVDTSGGRKD